MKRDVIIIGGGIVGLATAYQLLIKSPKLKILILEKESDVAKHQTGHNSGVIHSGIYYQPGSVKAKNCIKGYQYLLEFCKKNEIDYKLCGKLIVATEKNEIELLKNIYDRGQKNGLQNLEWFDQPKIKTLEPHINGLNAIYVPQAGIIDYKVVAQKLKAIINSNEERIQLNSKVIGLRNNNHQIEIITNNKTYLSDKVINCSGLYSDKIARLSGQKIDHKIVPFRGEYYRLKKEKIHLVNNLVYPVPNPNFPFLGVHLTPTIYGEIECGPNAVLAFKREGYKLKNFAFREFTESVTYPGFLRLASKYWKTGFKEMHQSFSKSAFTKAVQKLLPTITENDLEKSGSGVRAQALNKDGSMVEDFLIYDDQQHFINVCNTPSPAATSSLAIGEYVASFIN